METILEHRYPHWGREEIKAMLGLDTELKQTRFYQEVFAEGETEGELKGELNGERKLLRRLLVRRFGPLPEWAEAKLRERSQRNWKLGGERVLEAVTLEAVLAEG